MNETRTLCDVEECRKPNASRYFLFKERKADGAGGMEDWSYTFDLCPAHVNLFLNAMLDEVTKHSNGTDPCHVLALVDKFKIKTRVE